MLEDTTIHNAISDKALSSYFRSSGNLLEEESAVLGPGCDQFNAFRR